MHSKKWYIQRALQRIGVQNPTEYSITEAKKKLWKGLFYACQLAKKVDEDEMFSNEDLMIAKKLGEDQMDGKKNVYSFISCDQAVVNPFADLSGRFQMTYGEARAFYGANAEFFVIAALKDSLAETKERGELLTNYELVLSKEKRKLVLECSKQPESKYFSLRPDISIDANHLFTEDLMFDINLSAPFDTRKTRIPNIEAYIYIKGDCAKTIRMKSFFEPVSYTHNGVKYTLTVK